MKKKFSAAGMAVWLALSLIIPVSRGLAAAEEGTTINPARPPKACLAGEKNFPYLKSWVDRLGNFVAPYEVGSNDGSLFFAIGATYLKKRGAAELWKKDSVTLPVLVKKRDGRLETGWLGAAQTSFVPPKQGPDADLAAAARQMAEKSPGFWARFWTQIFTPLEIDLLSNCSKHDCKIKLAEFELKAITGAAKQYRLSLYQQAIMKRVEAYRATGSIYAYETHKKAPAGPLEWEDLPIDPKFPTQLGTHFWRPSERSSYGYEVLDAEPGHHKPVTALFSRECSQRGSGDGAYTLCTDLVLYNNHYFDFWGRIVVFFPWCGGEIALAYEAVDVDQIKGSRVARVLFGGEMRRLFGLLLETRLRRLHVLGS